MFIITKFMCIHSKNLFVFSVRRLKLKIFSSQMLFCANLEIDVSHLMDELWFELSLHFANGILYFREYIEDLKTCPCLKNFLTVSTFWVQHLLFATTFYIMFNVQCRFRCLKSHGSRMFNVQCSSSNCRYDDSYRFVRNLFFIFV